MSTEDNKAVVRRFAREIWNEKRLERADEIMADDYIDHGAIPGQSPGLEGFKRKGGMWVAAVPDLRVHTEDLFAEEDRVAVRWTAQGAHQGELLGIQPTGKRFRFPGLSIFRVAGGKVAEQWEEWDKPAQKPVPDRPEHQGRLRPGRQACERPGRSFDRVSLPHRVERCSTS
jgi:predicted ester cyclase